MKLEAKQRLIAARNQDWFDNLDSGKQKEYLSKHPNSKFGNPQAKKPQQPSKKNTTQAPKSSGTSDVAEFEKLSKLIDDYDSGKTELSPKELDKIMDRYYELEEIRNSNH